MGDRDRWMNWAVILELLRAYHSFSSACHVTLPTVGLAPAVPSFGLSPEKV